MTFFRARWKWMIFWGMMEMNDLTHLSLFSGIGGIGRAIADLGVSQWENPQSAECGL